ncbi:MAG: diaminopimelate decarboxylase [Candidatus Aminicenantes bacterium]|nr:diaminopimelate decarboxylase [Candidatus Aminicenantes bacterium]
MDYFIRKHNKLYCEELALSDIADKYRTPLFVYSLRTFVHHFKIASQAFRDIPHAVFYSAKANSNLSLLKIIAGLGGGCDVVSLGEYLAARKAGIKRIVFSGVGKQDFEIEETLRKGLDFFGVESENELRLIEKIAAKLKKRAPVSLRVNPDVDPKTHKYIATGLKSEKFGIPFREAEELYHFISNCSHLSAVGISMHLGSQILTTEPFVQGFKKLKHIFGRLKEKGIKLKYIDLGGGWAVPFTREQRFPGPSDYISALFPQMQNIDAEFIVEPGRSLIGNAGVLLSKVIYIKEANGKKFVITDAAMNDLIRPALYGASHRIKPVLDREGKSIIADVVGPICESSDIFAVNVELSNLREGDLICIFTAGAYGYSMASNYNSRLRPAEVLIDGNQNYLIRERESYPDLWRKQKLLKLSPHIPYLKKIS